MTDTAAPLRRRRTWDVALGIGLTVVVIVLAAVLGVAGALLVMASDSCGVAAACAEGRLSAGVLAAIIAPSVVAAVAIVALIERLVRRRRTFWVPLVGLAVQLLVWAGAAALVVSAVPSS